MEKIIKKFNLNNKTGIIRPLKIKDVDDLYRNEKLLIQEKSMYGVEKKRSKKEIKKEVLEWLKQMKNKKTLCLVVEIEKRVKGFAKIKKGDKDHDVHIGTLSIYLNRDIRGRGIGKMLLKEIINESKKNLKLKIIQAGVFETNKIAQNLYKKLGFVKSGEIKKGAKYFNKFVDDIIMVKYL